MNRTIIWVVVIVVILIGAYLLMNNGSTSQNDEATNPTNQDLPTNVGGEDVNFSTSTSDTIGDTPSMSELIKEDITVGTGTEAKVGDKVKVNYIGTLTNGTKFDASADHGGAIEFELDPSRVIKGWVDGVSGMKTGGKRKLTIPPDLAYGNQALPGIPANSTLVFEVELLEINGKK